MLEIRQGESFPIYLELTQDGQVLKPEMLQDLAVCVGSLRRRWSEGGIAFDETRLQWWFKPSSEETAAMEPGMETVHCHVGYQDGSVYILDLDRIRIRESCGEVLA